MCYLFCTESCTSLACKLWEVRPQWKDHMTATLCLHGIHCPQTACLLIGVCNQEIWSNRGAESEWPLCHFPYTAQSSCTFDLSSSWCCPRNFNLFNVLYNCFPVDLTFLLTGPGPTYTWAFLLRACSAAATCLWGRISFLYALEQVQALQSVF